ncbi:MAG: PD-(D/E)XK nuclease domain-containing protein, partial [Proteobacteria bacterium]|nr:PD-(D/E)XK nuclease domain-containing protein [Pseudomonadota bacterium]
DLDHFNASEMDLNAPMERAETPIPVLYQSGYVTIKSVKNGRYRLGFPNEEVRVSFLKGLMPYYSKLPEHENVSFIMSLMDALDERDVDHAMNLMRSFISSIPYNAERQDEAHYKSIFYLIFRIASEFCVRTEECTAAGRTDALIETDDTIFVFEFKLDGTAEGALKQIHDKGYAIPYEAGDKKVIKIGANFDKELRTLERWVVE